MSWFVWTIWFIVWFFKPSIFSENSKGFVIMYIKWKALENQLDEVDVSDGVESFPVWMVLKGTSALNVYYLL